MKLNYWLILAITLAGCGCDVTHDCTAAIETPPPPPAPIAKPKIDTAGQRAVVQHFDKAKDRELHEVFAPDATVEKIDRIAEADTAASRALTHLGQQPTFPQRALANARAAVRALEDALNMTTEPPGKSP